MLSHPHPRYLHFDHTTGNFKQSDSQSMLILNMLFEIEDALVDSGDIQSDFVVVAAQANLK